MHNLGRFGDSTDENCYESLVLEASRLLLVHQRGTVCRRTSRTRHWQLDSLL